MKDLINLYEYDKYGVRKLDNIISERLESILVDNVFNSETKIIIYSILDKKVL